MSWQENIKNYKLILAKWKIKNIFITFKVFGVKMSIEDIKFAVRRTCDQISYYFLTRKHEFLLILNECVSSACCT